VFSGRAIYTRANATENLLAMPGVPAPVSQGQHTLGAMLERERLEHRVRRLAIATAALRQRASAHRRDLGEPPRHIRQAIADFEAQLAALNDRLRTVVGDGRQP
jgi:hypothetical protein